MTAIWHKSSPSAASRASPAAKRRSLGRSARTPCSKPSSAMTCLVSWI